MSVFEKSHPHANIFHIQEMYEVYKKTKNFDPIFINLREDGKIVGVLLAVIQKEFSGVLGALTSRAIIWGGPIVKNNDPVLLNKLLKKYDRHIKKKAIYTQFRNLWDWGDCKSVFNQNGYEYKDHLDIFHDLTKSPDELLMEMHKGRRKNIRRAIKKGLEFNELKTKKQIHIGYELVKETYNKVSLPFPDYSLFKNSFEIMNGKEMVKFFGAFYKGKMIGFRAVLCFNNSIYDWYAGSDPKHLDKYPNDFLPWKIMEWGSKNGYEKFDFGGAGKPNEPYGVRDFKLKFGGELVNFGRFQKIHKPVLMKTGEFGLKTLKYLRKCCLK
jgi:lipid II:glycine glycyltransferase (peptidoglycan interpeptide bridge formation enzyme)